MSGVVFDYLLVNAGCYHRVTDKLAFSQLLFFSSSVSQLANYLGPYHRPSKLTDARTTKQKKKEKEKKKRAFFARRLDLKQRIRIIVSSLGRKLETRIAFFICFVEIGGKKAFICCQDYFLVVLWWRLCEKEEHTQGPYNVYPVLVLVWLVRYVLVPS